MSDFVDRKLTEEEFKLIKESVEIDGIFIMQEYSYRQDIINKMNNNTFINISDAIFYAPFVVLCLKERNNILSNEVKNEFNETKKQQLRQKLYLCNNLWRMINHYFAELY